MRLTKTLKEKRFREVILLGCIALGLLFAGYFVFMNNGENTNPSVNTATMSDTENKLCSILSEIEGVGKINAYVNESAEGEVSGVILVFEGADSLSVRLDVLDATSRALGVDRKNVLIYKMTE